MIKQLLMKPAMAANVLDTMHGIRQIVARIDAHAPRSDLRANHTG